MSDFEKAILDWMYQLPMPTLLAFGGLLVWLIVLILRKFTRD